MKDSGREREGRRSGKGKVYIRGRKGEYVKREENVKEGRIEEEKGMVDVLRG